MRNQALFSLKDKSKKLKCRLLQFLFGALRVKFSTVRGNFTILGLSGIFNTQEGFIFLIFRTILPLEYS